MSDILYQFPINATASQVFDCISAPKGLNAWWTKRSEGKPETGAVYKLFFDEQYQWQAIVSNVKQNTAFELQMTISDNDWNGTKVGFALVQKDKTTEVFFYHKGWEIKNKHFKISGFCWAMYLRILKRYIEKGERVPCAKRLLV